MTKNKTNTVTLNINVSAVKVAVLFLIALASALYIVLTDSFLPFGGSLYGAGYLIADIICPILLAVSLILAVSQFRLLGSRAVIIISAALAILIAGKYAWTFLSCLDSTGIFGIADASLNVLVVVLLHILFAAFVCAASYGIIMLCKSKASGNA